MAKSTPFEHWHPIWMPVHVLSALLPIQYLCWWIIWSSIFCTFSTAHNITIKDACKNVKVALIFISVNFSSNHLWIALHRSRDSPTIPRLKNGVQPEDTTPVSSSPFPQQFCLTYSTNIFKLTVKPSAFQFIHQKNLPYEAKGLV